MLGLLRWVGSYGVGDVFTALNFYLYTYEYKYIYFICGGRTCKLTITALQLLFSVSSGFSYCVSRTFHGPKLY